MIFQDRHIVSTVTLKRRVKLDQKLASIMVHGRCPAHLFQTTTSGTSKKPR